MFIMLELGTTLEQPWNNLGTTLEQLAKDPTLLVPTCPWPARAPRAGGGPVLALSARPEAWNLDTFQRDCVESQMYFVSFITI